jgi:hypothetical protein
MRKSFITEQYESVPAPGTFSTDEKRHFFGGKMLEIEDKLEISNISTRSSLHNLKMQHMSKPIIAPNQTSFEQYNSTKWLINFDSDALLTDYLYKQLMITNFDDNTPNYFARIDPATTESNRLYAMVLSYIKKNILGKYKLTKVLMYTKYYSLGTGVIKLKSGHNEPDIHITQYNPVFHPHVKLDDNGLLSNKIVPETLYFVPKGGTYEISFKQTQPSRLFTFAYYIDVVYEKI